jgi:hypothetical protein
MSISLFSKFSSRRRVVALALLLLLSVVGYLTYVRYHFYYRAVDRVSQDMSSYLEWKWYAEGMRASYQSDTVGGDTPEETLRMFVDALKANNIELASMYYIPEIQSQKYQKLSLSKINGNLEKYISHIEQAMLGQAKFSTTTGVYFISYNDALNPEFSDSYEMTFYQNSSSNLWKIVSP